MRAIDYLKLLLKDKQTIRIDTVKDYAGVEGDAYRVSVFHDGHFVVEGTAEDLEDAITIAESQRRKEI